MKGEAAMHQTFQQDFGWRNADAEERRSGLIGPSGGTARSFPTDGGAEAFSGDPTVWPCPKIWIIDIKNGRSSAKDGAPERLRCGTIQKEVS